MLLHVLTNRPIIFVVCFILPKMQLKAVNSSNVFLLKCRRITNDASTQAY